MNHLDHANQVAQSAHEGQSDKTGRSYFEHCRRVAAAVASDTGKIVAYLHDVVEKGTGWTLDRLREEGFPPDVIGAVDAMTRRADEEWEAFRGGSVCLNSFGRFAKWISASIMPPPSLVSAR